MSYLSVFCWVFFASIKSYRNKQFLPTIWEKRFFYFLVYICELTIKSGGKNPQLPNLNLKLFAIQNLMGFCIQNQIN